MHGSASGSTLTSFVVSGSLRRKPPIHHQDRPGEKAGVIAGHVSKESGDFVGTRDAAERMITGGLAPFDRITRLVGGVEVLRWV